MLKRTSSLCERTGLDHRNESFEHASTSLLTQNLDPDNNYSLSNPPSAPAIHSEALTESGLPELIRTQHEPVVSQPCNSVLTDYLSPGQSLCCLCGIPGCHCHTPCLSSKETPNRCRTCTARILPPCSFCSSALCDWRLRRWRRRRIPNENLFVLSVIQLLCGFASIILSSVALTKAVFLYQMATGMWAGFLMLITGTQGLIASRRPIACTLTGLFSFCVVVTVAACLLICVSVAGTIEDGFLEHLNPRSRSQHETIKLTYSFHPSSDGQKKSELFYSLTYHGMPDNQTVSRLSWNAIRRLYPDETASHFVSPSQEAHLRTCQVILHVLLLLIGILESSVSLSTCILIFRYVCSRSAHFTSNQNPFSTRTNIVSLSAATANQAASVLRSGELNQLIGSGNLLLAVSAGSSTDRSDSSISFLRRNSSDMEPYVHPSVAPFLPQLNRPALILTQAGALAWTAARAAATLVDRDPITTSNTSRETSSVNTTPDPVTDSPTRSSRLRQMFHRRNRARNRPQLLFTSLNTLNNGTVGGNNATNIVTGPPTCPPGSTLIYVMPSPSSDSPPMIFPPFPPVYSSLQKRPSTFSTPHRSSRVDRRNTHHSTTDSTNHSRSTRSSEYLHSIRSNTRRYFSRIFTWRRDPHRRERHVAAIRDRRSPPSRTPSSALICAGGNRLLQPVLIIEDPDIFCLNSVDPPPYSAIEQQELQSVPDSQDV